MSEIAIPDHLFIPEDELVELEALFARFVAALESEDDELMLKFFTDEQPFFDGASEIQNSIFMMAMHSLGLISEEEMAAVFSGDDLDADYLDIDFDDFTFDGDDDCDLDADYDVDPDADR